MHCCKRDTAASRSNSGETTASTAPKCRACSAFCSLPEAIHSIALSAPIRRGKRVVPPYPGMMPSLVSGSPIRAVSDMTR